MAKKSEPQLPLGETIIEKSMDTVMHESMLPYAEHVILERALPRVEEAGAAADFVYHAGAGHHPG